MQWELINKNHCPDNLSTLSRRFEATFTSSRSPSLVYSVKGRKTADNLSFFFVFLSPILLDFPNIHILCRFLSQNRSGCRALVCFYQNKDIHKIAQEIEVCFCLGCMFWNNWVAENVWNPKVLNLCSSLYCVAAELIWLVCPSFTVTCCPTRMCATVTWPGLVSGWRRPGWSVETLAVRSQPSWRRSPSRTWLPRTSHVTVTLTWLLFSKTLLFHPLKIWQKGTNIKDFMQDFFLNFQSTTIF